MICNFVIFLECVDSRACLSAKTSETPANINLQGFPFPGCRPTEKKEKTSDKPRYAGLGCLQQRPSPSRYDLCSTLSKKRTDETHRPTPSVLPARGSAGRRKTIARHAGNPRHPDHPGRHTRRRRPHHPCHRRRNAYAAANRAGRGERQSLG